MLVIDRKCRSKKRQCFHNGGPAAFLCIEDYTTISSWMNYSKVGTCTLHFVMHPVSVLPLCPGVCCPSSAPCFCLKAFSVQRSMLGAHVQTWTHSARELMALGVSSSDEEWGLLATHLNFLALWVGPFSTLFTCVPGVCSEFKFFTQVMTCS